ncbi:MAG TPA: efflux RND transporter periplasmic adaptor subunit [Bryobacteraceae bacterium]|nr:efflux RND transporter periplasmic adaptor subunit [Bryobacteraceae bacterium]HTF69668.1 efflux RND transporter periplasmic adaptor subunit [Edaphobacter sp.]
MNRTILLEASLCLALSFACASCAKKASSQEADTGPKAAAVEPDMDANHFKVDRPELFPLATAGIYCASPELNTTGVVSPDVSRQVPVISLASGRVVEINARLGDQVSMGQILFKVRSPDIAQAFSDYRKAVSNEQLAKVQLDRAQVLYDKGAVPKSSLDAARNAEDNAKVDLDTTAEHLRVLGSDLDHPTGIVPVYAPVAGVITDQQITNAAGVQALATASPLTISDMSHVWIVCDVYENDLAQVQMGEFADIRLNAYPDRILKGRIGNIGEILDPNIRTAKVRLEVANPNLLRFGMFVTATFHGQRKETHATVPATAVLHLHDRDWIYTPAGSGIFKRVEVVGGNMLPGSLQEINSGIAPGTKVVANALVLQNTVEQ